MCLVAQEIQATGFSEPKQLTLGFFFFPLQINGSVCKTVVTAESWSTAKVNRSVMTFSEQNTDAAVCFLPEVSDFSSARGTDSRKVCWPQEESPLCHPSEKVRL